MVVLRFGTTVSTGGYPLLRAASCLHPPAKLAVSNTKTYREEGCRLGTIAPPSIPQWHYLLNILHTKGKQPK